MTIVREGNRGLDYLVLFDSVIVLDGPSELKVVTDRRVDAFAQAEESAIREHPIGSPAHQARVDELVAAQRPSQPTRRVLGRRGQAGGV